MSLRTHVHLRKPMGGMGGMGGFLEIWRNRETVPTQVCTSPIQRTQTRIYPQEVMARRMSAPASDSQGPGPDARRWCGTSMPTKKRSRPECALGGHRASGSYSGGPPAGCGTGGHRPDSEPGHCNLEFFLGSPLHLRKFSMVVETAHVWNTPGKGSFRRAMGGH